MRSRTGKRCGGQRRRASRRWGWRGTRGAGRVSPGRATARAHVIANRVDPESGKAAGLSRSKLKLSKWAEEYERRQGKIRCPQRERNNARRGQGKRVQDRVSRPTGRHRREEMNPQQEERQAIPAGRDGWGGPERERVAWQRAEERGEWEQLVKDCRGVLGRFRLWRELGLR